MIHVMRGGKKTNQPSKRSRCEWLSAILLALITFLIGRRRRDLCRWGMVVAGICAGKKKTTLFMLKWRVFLGNVLFHCEFQALCFLHMLCQLTLIYSTCRRGYFKENGCSLLMYFKNKEARAIGSEVLRSHAGVAVRSILFNTMEMLSAAVSLGYLVQKTLLG